MSYEYGFSNSWYNGNISGIKWRSKGDGEQRAFGYDYDAVNRLLKADFTQYTSSSWGTTAGFDFSVSNMSYDANGNILAMNQKGWKPGGSITIDSLLYTYTANTNRLLNVLDRKNDTTTRLGDFRSSKAYMTLLANNKTTAATDYTYDANGNLKVDNNKDIGTIRYNHLNLPDSIAVTGKGTVKYMYDAAGNKLKKITAEGAKITTTLYIGGMVYQNDTLQFISHEEGRIRYKAIGNSFQYDYMIKDHLGNVRVVLTEEQQTNIYPAATLEGTYDASTNSMVNTEKQFYRIDNTKIISESSIASWVSPAETVANTKLYYNNNGNPPANTNYPAGCTPLQTDGSTKVYKLNATANKTGLEFIIKVMAGDKIDILGKSYFLNTTTVNNANSTSLDLLSLMTNLLLSPGNAVAGKGLTAATLNTINTGQVPTSFFRGANGETTTIPKAYINYIFLDEQFKYAGGNFSRVGSSGTVKNHWNTDVQLQNISVPKNGYIFVYVSNESNLDVFFDNLQVIHKPGPLLEETHYYPFGLTMAGISSQALNFGSPENKRKFNKGSELQNKEFSDGSGLELYATNFRSLDPQLGRWWQIDPKPDYAQSLYSAMNNNPISFNDPLGDTIIVDKRGNVVKQYGTDNLVFLQKGKKLSQIGELGKSIDGNKIFKNLLNKNIAYARNHSSPFGFRDLVKNKGEWDLKNNKNTIYGLANSFDKGKEAKTQFAFQGSNYTAEELGNYHYGATGKAWNFFMFTEETLLEKAGDAQIAAGTSKPEWQKYRTEYRNAGHGEQYEKRVPIAPYGDDPHDQEMIKRGFKYYDTNKNNLQEED
jgi:RHS repeat-associated protein